MHLQLDTRRMRAAMDLWRQEAASEPRAEALTKLAATLAGWLDLLRLCSPDQDGAGELQLIVDEVAQLREWAEEGAAALRLMGGRLDA